MYLQKEKLSSLDIKFYYMCSLFVNDDFKDDVSCTNINEYTVVTKTVTKPHKIGTISTICIMK